MAMKGMPEWAELKTDWMELMGAIAEAKRDDGKVSLIEAVNLAPVLVDALVQHANGFNGVPGAEKREWVISICWDIYHQEIDLDIPFIPEPIESFIEEGIMKHLVPQLIELFVRARRGIEGIFHKDDLPPVVMPK